MSFSYRFSVGKIQVGSNDLGVVTDVAVSYDGDPQSFYGGDYRLPLAVELGNQSGEITCTTARFKVDGHTNGPLDNNYCTVTLTAGQNGGGLVATIQFCKVTAYNVTSTQNAFVTSDLTLIMCDPDSNPSNSASWASWTSCS